MINTLCISHGQVSVYFMHTGHRSLQPPDIQGLLAVCARNAKSIVNSLNLMQQLLAHL